MGVTDAAAARRILIYRHPIIVRLTHWTNVVALTILLMSGLQIFNAHPALYWGEASNFEHPWLSLTAVQKGDKLVGTTQIGDWRLTTTGMLGASGSGDDVEARGFPAWATIPSNRDLTTGRLWHFFFAWIFFASTALYLLYGLIGRHVWRDLLPNGRDIRHFGKSVWEHARFRFPRGEAARHYNVLQKLAYLVVVFGLFPLIILTGLTMSPRMVAGFPDLLWVFGGRQSARSLHFIGAVSLLAFVLIHVFMVLVSGLFNNLRSMVTGRYAITDEGANRAEA